MYANRTIQGRDLSNLGFVAWVGFIDASGMTLIDQVKSDGCKNVRKTAVENEVLWDIYNYPRVSPCRAFRRMGSIQVK
jgi:hypothetical protein